MKLHIKLGASSGTIRDEHDNILAMLGWQEKLNAYLIMGSDFPELLKRTVLDGYELQHLVYSELGIRPTIEVFAPPPDTHLRPFRNSGDT